MTPTQLLDEVEDALLDRRELITQEQAYALADLADGVGDTLPRMLDLAHRVRLAWCGEEVSLESILSSKTGGCPEDCAFCSQSSAFNTPVKPQPYLTREEVVGAARDAQGTGATEFCLVLAIKGPDEKAMAHILEAAQAIQEETQLEVAVSAGLLTREQAETIAAAGVIRYNHNLEAARSFFPSICTTHGWEERWETCQFVRDAGMELCSGGILGMGETPRQRAELALALRELQPAEVPVNFLNPRPGTPLQKASILDPRVALHGVALFRLVIPFAMLRYAGGREVVLGDLQGTGILGGANGLIVGNYLTTLGRSTADDVRMLHDLAVPVKALTGIL
ncbi:MAG: biotin synthase BioB [Nitriliruptorales bacterium]|nr:biotin synthase BioB [Nitriliruptorales bacterium]